MSDSILQLEQIYKEYTVDDEKHEVIRNLNLRIDNNSFVCILGYTGCGKSTLLRMICGYEHQNSGTIKFMGRIHNKPSKDVVMVFQETEQLYPWKTAVENISFVIRNTNKRIRRKEAREQAKQLLKEVDLMDYANYYPNQLSSGMRQRVAVARALAAQPKLLLMDEPFSALDELTRRKLQDLCRKIFDEHNISVLFVTHSIEESLTLADQIVIMGQQSGNIITILENQCRKNHSKQTREAMRSTVLDYLLSNKKGEI